MTESIVMSGYPDHENVSQILPDPHDIFVQKPACVQLRSARCEKSWTEKCK